MRRTCFRRARSGVCASLEPDTTHPAPADADTALELPWSPQRLPLCSAPLWASLPLTWPLPPIKNSGTALLVAVPSQRTGLLLPAQRPLVWASECPVHCLPADKPNCWSCAVPWDPGALGRQGLCSRRSLPSAPEARTAPAPASRTRARPGLPRAPFPPPRRLPCVYQQSFQTPKHRSE